MALRLYLSNRLLSRMLRIEREFATTRVRCSFVYPNSTETPAIISAHRATYGIDYKDRTLTDSHETFGCLAGVTHCPRQQSCSRKAACVVYGKVQADANLARAV